MESENGQFNIRAINMRTEIIKAYLLSIDEITELMTDTMAANQAKLIYPHISNVCFITGDKLYIRCENLMYTAHAGEKVPKELLVLLLQLHADSYAALTPKDKEYLTLKFKKVDAFGRKPFVANYLESLQSMLTVDHIKVNLTPRQIHFLNGYVDTETLEFKPRQVGKHFITRAIPWNYTKPTDDDMAEVLTILKKIFPVAEDLACMLRIMGSTLSWECTKDQTALFILGTGASGKSFFMDMISKCLGDIYVHEFQCDTFESGNSKQDKYLIHIADVPKF